MDREQIVAMIDQEIDALHQAREILTRGELTQPSTPTSAGNTKAQAPSKKRVLSFEARERIVAAQKKRWAAHNENAQPQASSSSRERG